MSRGTVKLIFGAALTAQAIGAVVLLTTDYSSRASGVAFWVVIGAGIVEVALALNAKRKGEPIDG